jgi:hypothetical protein
LGSPNENDLGLERPSISNSELENQDSCDLDDDLDNPRHQDKGKAIQIQADPEKKPEFVKEVQFSRTDSDTWSVISNTLLHSNPGSFSEREAASYTQVPDNVGAPESSGAREIDQATQMQESGNSSLDTIVAAQEPSPLDPESQIVDVPTLIAASEIQNVPMQDVTSTPPQPTATEAIGVTFRTPRSAGRADDLTSSTFTPLTIPGSVNEGKWIINVTKPPSCSASVVGPVSWSQLHRILGLDEETVSFILYFVLADFLGVVLDMFVTNVSDFCDCWNAKLTSYN